MVQLIRGAWSTFRTQNAGIASVLEWTGAGLSILCVIHCLGMPLLLTLPVSASVTTVFGPTTESVLLYMALSVVFLRTWSRYRSHHRGAVWFVFVLAAGLILAGRWFVPGVWETRLVVPGAVSLALLVVLNRLFCRHCRVCRNHDDEPNPCSPSPATPRT